MNKGDTYTCHHCKKSYESEWTEEEARDDCYTEAMRRFNARLLS